MHLNIQNAVHFVSVMYNSLLVANAQQQIAASRRLLRAGQRQR